MLLLLREKKSVSGSRRFSDSGNLLGTKKQISTNVILIHLLWEMTGLVSLIPKRGWHGSRLSSKNARN